MTKGPEGVLEKERRRECEREEYREVQRKRKYR
jgi:hypothetical protein